MALTVIERAGDHRHPAIGLEADAAHFLGGGRGDLEIAADPPAAQPAPRPAVALAILESLPIGDRDGAVEQ